MKWLNVLPLARLFFPSLAPSKDAPGSKSVEPGVVPNANLGLPSVAPTGKAGGVIAKLAGTDGFSTIKLVPQPTTTSPTRATFRLGGPDGMRLRPNEEILLEIPPQFRGRAVYQAVIEHRQVLSEKSSVPTGEVKKWDETPGVTALHFHPTGKGDEWRYWNAPWGSSGTDGGKYAEIRPDWECESHFDFAKNGTSPVGGGKISHATIAVDALRLRGVGDDPTFIREVIITFAPPKPTHVDEHVFTPGTTIGELLTAKGQAYGKDTELGVYPGALALLDGGEGGAGIAKLKPGWTFEDGQLSIPLAAGKSFSGVEVAIGDTKPDGKLNTDGEIGTQGHARLRMGLLRAGAKKPEWFVDDHGVPPQGVLFGGPAQEHRAKAGDRLVLAASVDPAYLMALRVSYTD